MAHIPKTGQSGTELGEIEITPEMMAAGERVLEAWDYDSPELSHISDYQNLAKHVFRQMLHARPA
jgi:hypothetical protein